MVSSRNLVNFVAEFSDVVAERSDKGRVDADAEVGFLLGQMQCEVVDARRKRTSRSGALPKTCFEKTEIIIV